MISYVAKIIQKPETIPLVFLFVSPVFEQDGVERPVVP